MKSIPKDPSANSLPQLAARLAAGDIAAIASIYEQTYRSLFFYGLQIAGTHQQYLVEGTIQDLFIWLAKNYQKVAAIDHLEAYLYQSIRRNLQQHLQAEQLKNKAFKRYQLRTKPNQPTAVDSPEKTFISQEEIASTKTFLTKHLNQLPSYQKEVLYLRFFENRSYKEIAALLSINSQVARNYVFRALSHLRKSMGKLLFLIF